MFLGGPRNLGAVQGGPGDILVQNVILVCYF